MTGIYVTTNNSRAMDNICTEKLQHYDAYFIDNKLMHPTFDNGIEVYRRVAAFETEMKYDSIMCFATLRSQIESNVCINRFSIYYMYIYIEGRWLLIKISKQYNL